MSKQNGEKPVDLEKILDNVEQNNRRWVPANESMDYGRKSNDSTTVSRTFAPPRPDGGDDTKKD